MKAHISISEDKSSIVVLVDDLIVFKKPYVKIAVKSVNGSIVDRLLTIPVLDKSNLLNQYSDTKDIFKEAGCVVEVSESASETVDVLENAEEEFLRSCKEARDVWEGNLDSNEFKEFAHTLQQLFPSRTLSERQILSAYHLAATSAACNFSVPGAGKTTIVLAAYAYLNSLPSSDPRHVNCLLVVGPMACFEPWESDFEKCFERRPRAIRIMSSLNSLEKRQVLSGIDPGHRNDELYLSHFQTFSIYEEYFKELLLRADKKVMIVIDEAHNIKGHDGVWSGTALRQARYAQARVILSGTPAPNGYEDLLNLFDFIHPDRNVLGFSRQILKLMSEDKMSPAQLQVKSRPFFTRVRKKDLGLPPATFSELIVPMSQLQQDIYRAIESSVVPNLPGHQSARKKLFQAASLIRLRQAASNPKQLALPLSREMFDMDMSITGSEKVLDKISQVSEMVNRFSNSDDLPKISKLMELVKQSNLQGEKVLIWSYFISNIELIQESLKRQTSSPVFTITGATPVEQETNANGEQEELTREKILHTFRNHEGAAFLIATPQCLGESVSLHHWCHKAIYFDRDFNCGMFIQSKDRIHRFGLAPDTKTEYIFLISSNTIDEDINFRLSKKEDRMSQLLDSEDIPLLSEDFFKEQNADIKQVLDSYAARQLR